MDTNFPLESLILISLDSALDKKKSVSFGALVKECFSLFPEAFSLIEYPRWPDTLKLDRPLRKLKEKGYINGNPKTHFTLTRFGASIVEEIKAGKNLDGIEFINKKVTRSPDLALLREIQNSKELSSFLKNKVGYVPNNMSIRGLTNFTLETPIRTVSNYLGYLRKIAKKEQEENVAEFLNLYIEFFNKKEK